MLCEKRETRTTCIPVMTGRRRTCQVDGRTGRKGRRKIRRVYCYWRKESGGGV